MRLIKQWWTWCWTDSGPWRQGESFRHFVKRSSTTYLRYFGTVMTFQVTFIVVVVIVLVLAKLLTG